MKNNPFPEIMNFNAERNEYIKLCKCESEKYTYYSEWKQHVAECIQKITNTDKLEDFRHYCISRKRTTSKGPELFGTYTGLLIGTYATMLLDHYLNSFVYSIVSIIALTCAVIFLLCYL